MSQPNPIEVEEPLQTAVSEYRPIAAALHDLYVRHAGVIHDVTTTKGMQACREARAEIRTCRTSLEAKRKEIKAPVLERCRLIDAEAKRITDALIAIEDPLDEQIKAEEVAAEARREAKRKADMEREAELRRMVDSINAWPLSCLGSTADEIREAISGYEQTDIPSGPEIPAHYRAEATSAKVRALDQLRKMLAGRERKEAEEARLAAERAAERERQAAEDKRLRAEQQRLDAERQEHERLAAEEWARVQREAHEAEQRLAAERAVMERELAEEHARMVAERARAELSVLWEASETSEPVPQVSEVQAAGFVFPSAEPGTTVMRVRFEKLGGHYHCRVFTAKQTGQTFAKNGDLVFDEAEWPDIPLLMRGAEFIEESSAGWP